MDDFFAAMRLSALLDNTLDDDEKAQVEAAIRQSPRLRVQYSRMMTAVELIRSQGSADPPHPPGMAASDVTAGTSTDAASWGVVNCRV